MANARKFKIKGLLGKGGFGLVYRATLVSEGGFQTEVAIKLLKSEELSKPMLARFKDEARVLGLIRDRAVVRVFPPAMLDSTPALIMEYVDGLSTSSILKLNQGPLPARVVTEIVSEIARSLHDVFHQAGPDGNPLRLVHRDIKPANIQVTPNGTVKLLDFGIAKAAFEGREAETTAHLFGTPQYMAPERLMGHTGPESDIFSLGCTWRRLMIGDRPIGGGQFKPSKKPPKPTRMLEEATDFISRMIAIEEEDRPNAAEVHEFCEDIQQRMGGASLRQWSGKNITSAPAQPDDLSGTVLMESIALESASFDLSMPTAGPTGMTLQQPDTTSTLTLSIQQQEVAKRVMVGLGLIAMLFGLMSVGIGGYALYLLVEGPEELEPMPGPVQPVAVPEPVVPVPVEPEPAPSEPAPVAAPVTPAPARPAPVPRPQPAVPPPEPVVQPNPVSPAPAPPPDPAPSGPTIQLSAGDAIVILRDGAGSKVRPGPVPAGRYVVWVAYDKTRPSDLVKAAEFELKGDQSVLVHCASAMKRCLIKPR